MLDARLWACLSYLKSGSWSYSITGLHLSMTLEVATVYGSENILLFKKSTCMGDFSFLKDNFTPKFLHTPMSFQILKWFQWFFILQVNFGYSLIFSFFQSLLISNSLPPLDPSLHYIIFHHTLLTFPPLYLSLSLCAMVGGEWVCGGLICSLKRHASPSNASCRSFPSSSYPSLS